MIRRGTATPVFEIADTVLRDLRIAVRGWALAPMFGAGAIATLTVGIAALMSVFLLVNGALLRPLPYPESDRLVVLQKCLARPAGALLMGVGTTREGLAGSCAIRRGDDPLFTGPIGQRVCQW